MNRAVTTLTPSCSRCTAAMALHSVQMAAAAPMDVFYCAPCDKYAAAPSQGSRSPSAD
jgi:hypothetical protein